MSSRAKSKSAVITLALLFGIFSIAFFGSLPFSLPLLSILVLIFLTTKGTVMLWTVVVGSVMELVSPYPAFTYFLALLCALVLLRICMRHYFSHRTVISAAVAGTIGNSVLALGLQGLSRLGVKINAGWIPALDWAFARSFFTQTLLVALITAVLLAVIRRVSPSLRGVTMSRDLNLPIV